MKLSSSLSRAICCLGLLLPSARAAATEWDDIRASYGILTHVAGIGGDQNLNSWIPAYENTQGVNVELSNPHMAQADAAGNIYIADKESHSVLKVAVDGTITTVAGTHLAGFNGDGPALSVHLSNPNGLFVLADGTYYILDLDNRMLRRVGTNGQLTTVVTEPSFLGGRALWVSPDEQLIYYAGRNASNQPCLKRWTPGAGIEVVASGFTALGNITVDPIGRPIVTEDTGNRVQRVEPNGSLTLLAGNGATSGGGDGQFAIFTGLDRVRGVACLPNGGLFIATQKGSHIWYVDTEGIIHKFMDCSPSGSINAGNGQLYSTPGIKMSEPRAITVSPNGDLVITASDFGHVRVVKCVRPPAPPVALGLETDTAPGSLRLRWAGPAWQSYFVDFTPSLTPAAWQQIGIRTSLPGDTLHALPAPGVATQGFYRVRVPGGAAVPPATAFASISKKAAPKKAPRRTTNRNLLRERLQLVDRQ